MSRINDEDSGSKNSGLYSNRSNLSKKVGDENENDRNTSRIIGSSSSHNSYNRSRSHNHSERSKSYDRNVINDNNHYKDNNNKDNHNRDDHDKDNHNKENHNEDDNYKDNKDNHDKDNHSKDNHNKENHNRNIDGSSYNDSDNNYSNNNYGGMVTSHSGIIDYYSPHDENNDNSIYDTSYRDGGRNNRVVDRRRSMRHGEVERNRNRDRDRDRDRRYSYYGNDRDSYYNNEKKNNNENSSNSDASNVRLSTYGNNYEPVLEQDYRSGRRSFEEGRGRSSRNYGNDEELRSRSPYENPLNSSEMDRPDHHIIENRSNDNVRHQRLYQEQDEWGRSTRNKNTGGAPNTIENRNYAQSLIPQDSFYNFPSVISTSASDCTGHGSSEVMDISRAVLMTNPSGSSSVLGSTTGPGSGSSSALGFGPGSSSVSVSDFIPTSGSSSSSSFTSGSSSSSAFGPPLPIIPPPPPPTDPSSNAFAFASASASASASAFLSLSAPIMKPPQPIEPPQPAIPRTHTHF